MSTYNFLYHCYYSSYLYILIRFILAYYLLIKQTIKAYIIKKQEKIIRIVSFSKSEFRKCYLKLLKTKLLSLFQRDKSLTKAPNVV